MMLAPAPVKSTNKVRKQRTKRILCMAYLGIRIDQQLGYAASISIN